MLMGHSAAQAAIYAIRLRNFLSISERDKIHGASPITFVGLWGILTLRTALIQQNKSWTT